MKKVFLLFSLLGSLLFLSSCGSGAVWSSIGMTKKEFLNTKKNRKRVYLIQENSKTTIYRMKGADWFYYFENDILVEKNQGQRQSDFIIENRNR